MRDAGGHACVCSVQCENTQGSWDQRHSAAKEAPSAVHCRLPAAPMTPPTMVYFEDFMTIWLGVD
ncbi:MAG: hypothetical protein U0271_25520 [Polyangiaceae bacterium]